ncbi:hypothetical protein ABH940_005539 [Streptacidiphilus sp. BW17]|uniref:relaxase/mobilization nuclease domain-containing protein n=1 Tax=Streptacidiphilus sp. BW17 TaxID=3156274 RepID=UPI0035144C11
MVPKIGKPGTNTLKVLQYLYGKERHAGSPHTDPHLVASWDGYAPDPGRQPDATLKQLADQLDLRVKQLGVRKPKTHVWHCSVRAAPTDRHLTDEEWAMIARRVLAAAGIAKEGDANGCRWVAVRHADDHIHLVATKVQGDLTGPRIRGDAGRVQKACRKIERELGLRRLATGDKTATRRPTQAEVHKAEQRGLPEPTRETLKEAVRLAVVGARTDEEFVANLEVEGVMIKLRRFPSGDLQGYSVALPGDVNAAGDPVWYSGTTLGYPLGRVRSRLSAAVAEGVGPEEVVAPVAFVARSAVGSKAFRARRDAVLVVEHALDVIVEGDDESAMGQIDGVGEILGSMAQTAVPGTASRAQLLALSRVYERAARSHVRASRRETWAMRSAARSIFTSGYAVDREDGAAAVELMSALVAVLFVAASWHAARGHEQQAQAAQSAAQQLRQLYSATARRPLEVLSARGRAVSAPQRQRYAHAVREVLPEAASESGERDWDALTATLAEAEAAGHDPVELLERARCRRELETADSVTAVMVWRVRRLADLPPVGSARGRKAVRAAVPTTAPVPARSDPGRRRVR